MQERIGRPRVLVVGRRESEGVFAEHLLYGLELGALG